MLNLQIPYWPMIACGGWILGVASVALLGWWASQLKQKKMLDALGKIAVKFDAPQEGENDAEDHHPGAG